MKKFSGIIFDMDGVLLDTEEAMLQSTIEGFADYGVFVKPEDFTPFFGTGSAGYFGGVCAKYGMPCSSEFVADMYQKYLAIVDKEAIRYPGIPQEIEKLHKAGYKLAIASSAAKIKVLANIKAAGINPAYIDFVVTEDDITNNKPDPEIFLKAAKGLGLPPEECLVAEDAVSGIKAAVSAGIACVGVRGTYSDKELLNAGAHKLVSHQPSPVKTLTLTEALTWNAQELYSFRCEGGRLEILSELPYEHAHEKLKAAGICYDRLVIQGKNTVYNMYHRQLSIE